MSLTDQDKEKFNTLYQYIKDTPIPDFDDPEAVEMAKDVKWGLDLINQSIKEVSKVIK